VGCVFEALRKKAESYVSDKNDLLVAKRFRERGLKGLVGGKCLDFVGETPKKVEKQLFFESIIDGGVCGSFYNDEITVNTKFDNCSGGKGLASGKKMGLGGDEEGGDGSCDFFDDFEVGLVEEEVRGEVCAGGVNFEKSRLEDATNYAVSRVINMALGKKSGDNITVILVLFKPLGYFLGGSG
jgi:hypothetical protein